MNRFKRFLFCALAVAMLLALTACGPAASNTTPSPTQPTTAPTENVPTEKPTDPVVSGTYNIATASIGGAFYPFGQEIANLVNKYSGGLNMTPEVTGGAAENPRLIDSGDCDFAITNENVAVYALEGTNGFDKPINLMGLGRLYPSVFHIVSLQGSGINEFADLKGKRVAVGPAGGGTMVILEQLFEYYGMSINDFTPSYLPYSDGFTQLADGNVDAAVALGGYPASAVLECANTKAIQLISIKEEVWDEFLEDYPYYSKTLVTKDYYKTPEDVYLIGIPNVLVCSPDIDDDVVYMVCKSIFEHIPEFQAANANARDLEVEGASMSSIPFHPGAIRYFAEKGYTVD
jgi:TRAP transporter TAXI family solute receptor